MRTITKGKLIPFWIGDSRLYLLRNGQLILLTKDHTIAQEKVDYGIISQEEAKTVSGWHFVTAYIGDGQSIFALGEVFDIEAGDKYLLCTDGISDRLPAQTLADFGVELFVHDISKAQAKSSRVSSP